MRLQRERIYLVNANTGGLDGRSTLERSTEARARRFPRHLFTDMLYYYYYYDTRRLVDSFTLSDLSSDGDLFYFFSYRTGLISFFLFFLYIYYIVFVIFPSCRYIIILMRSIFFLLSSARPFHDFHLSRSVQQRYNNIIFI